MLICNVANTMLSAEAARAKVVEIVSQAAPSPNTETVDLAANPALVLGRVIAEHIVADRDYPPFDRSIRDGFAVHSVETSQPGTCLRIVGESRAGVPFDGTVGRHECVRIFTGAALPPGTDAVIMQEYARVENDCVTFEQPAQPGLNYVHAGKEAPAGEIVVPRGSRLGFSELAMAAQVGYTQIVVARKPRIAILTTGDEIVDVNETPGPYEIRNSNSSTLAALVTLAGGEPVICGNAPDNIAELRKHIEHGLKEDALVLSGGVSVGEYDFVESVLKDLGAEFFFDSVALRPGKPTVFGWCQGTPVFGLPGNPVSTMITFQLFVQPAIELMSGIPARPIAYFKAKLATPVRERGAITHFIPARVTYTDGDPVVEPVRWEGSADIGAIVRGNCYLVVRPDRLELSPGSWVDILPRPGW